MSTRFAVVGRRSADTAPLIGVLPCGESVRVLRSSSWTPGAQAAAVGRALIPLLPADAVVVLGSGQDDRDLAGWLAMTLDAPVIWVVETVRATSDGIEIVRTTHGGRVRVVHEVDTGPVVVLAEPAGDRRARSAVAENAATFDVPDDLDGIVATTAPGHPRNDHDVPLTTAEIVVSVGRGIGGPEHLDLFRDLAGRLGGALGASRVVVDSGWLPFAHQVGQTGASVAPAVYLAFGISGALQHQAGMRDSQIVIAVNIDREAPLCRVASLVVEGDAVTVASALLDRLDRRLIERPPVGSKS